MRIKIVNIENDEEIYSFEQDEFKVFNMNLIAKEIRSSKEIKKIIGVRPGQELKVIYNNRKSFKIAKIDGRIEIILPGTYSIKEKVEDMVYGENNLYILICSEYYIRNSWVANHSELYGNKSFYLDTKKINTETAKVFGNKIQALSINRQNVFLGMPNLKRKYRERIISLNQNKFQKIIGVHFDMDLDEMCKWLNYESEQVKERCCKNMTTKEFPKNEEGFDEIINVTNEDLRGLQRKYHYWKNTITENLQVFIY